MMLICGGSVWLVGPPGFEPGTSCTPSNKYQSLTDAFAENKRLRRTKFGRQLDAKAQKFGRLDSSWTPHIGSTPALTRAVVIPLFGVWGRQQTVPIYKTPDDRSRGSFETMKSAPKKTSATRNSFRIAQLPGAIRKLMLKSLKS